MRFKTLCLSCCEWARLAPLVAASHAVLTKPQRSPAPQVRTHLLIYLYPLRHARHSENDLCYYRRSVSLQTAPSGREETLNGVRRYRHRRAAFSMPATQITCRSSTAGRHGAKDCDVISRAATAETPGTPHSVMAQTAAILFLGWIHPHSLFTLNQHNSIDRRIYKTTGRRPLPFSRSYANV
jgi:hypothetical protein